MLSALALLANQAKGRQSICFDVNPPPLQGNDIFDPHLRHLIEAPHTLIKAIVITDHAFARYSVLARHKSLAVFATKNAPLLLRSIAVALIHTWRPDAASI
jgi:hypothetical protein